MSFDNESFIGTRSDDENITFSEAILNPSANLGGLYVPENIPFLEDIDLIDMMSCNYKDLTFHILQNFGVDVNVRFMYDILEVYDNFDNPDNPVPVISIDDNTFVSELWHGPTRAFKDMALQPFPRMLNFLATEKNKNYLVLAATSGDTGPAALEGFKTKIVCFYPEGGTSKIQKEQMIKATGDNVKVIGIKGNFDDAQKALKKMISSDEFKSKLQKKGFELSAANSINFGRIVFQVVYHFWSYFELVRQKKISFGDEIISIIPSGNFGNALAAYYAKEMGLPLKKIVLASNKNNILTDFVNTGKYDLRNRKLYKTNSPAMDILISSNIERLLFHLFGFERTKELMDNLENKKYFTLTDKEKLLINYTFDMEVQTVIDNVYFHYDYVIDPHTATAFAISFRKEYDKVLIHSTAEWTKFIEIEANIHDCKRNLETLSSKLGVPLSEHIKKLKKLPVVHTTIIEKEDIENEVLNFV